MIILKSSAELRSMRAAGRVVAQAHEVVRQLIRPGISTWELDRKVEEFLLEQNAVPAFKGYHGFPASICASINEVVVHGIPDKEAVLQEGTIISVDIGAFVDGFAETAPGLILWVKSTLRPGFCWRLQRQHFLRASNGPEWAIASPISPTLCKDVLKNRVFLWSEIM